MCLIVDANKLGKFLAEPPDEEAEPIHRWLARPRGAGALVYSTGGKFEKELSPKARTKLAAYARAGRARLVPAGRVAEREKSLKASGQLRSNDSHVLALALASRCRLLYTADQALIQDFKNPAIVSDPRGKAYSSAAHAKLLTASVCRA